MPEFLARIDKMVMFKTLEQDEVRRILDIQLTRFKKQIEVSSNTEFKLHVSPAAIAQLLAEGFNKRENARYLKKTLEERVGMPLAKVVATGQVFSNDDVVVDYKDGEWRYFAATGNVASSIPKGQLEVPQVQQP